MVEGGGEMGRLGFGGSVLFGGLVSTGKGENMGCWMEII
jgi:hypothetical protein